MTSQQDTLNLYANMLTVAHEASAQEPYFRVKRPSMSELFGLVVITLLGASGVLAILSQVR